MIGVLPDDDHFYLVKWAEIESIEYQPTGRIYRSFAVFVPHEVGQGAEIRFIKFRLKPFFPTFFYLYVHK